MWRFVDDVPQPKISTKYGLISASYELRTTNHAYHLMTSVDSDGGYLGCIVTEISSDRGNDLHDGKFSYQTWVGILSDIVAYELRT